MEVVYQTHRYPSMSVATGWQMKPAKKRRSLMQRLSSWFEDHLPLRRRSDVRRSERGSRRKASKSAAPRMRYSINNAQKQQSEHHLIDQLPLSSTAGPHSLSVSMIGKESIFDDGYTDHHRYQPYYDDMSVSTFSHLGPRHPAPFADTPLSQSFSSAYSSCRRPRIRTNPWIQSRASSTRQPTVFRSPQPATLASRSIYSAPDALSSSAKDPQASICKPPELLYSSMDRTAQLRVKSLDESTCSSGYGSQDSSPESSVHFPDWQQAGGRPQNKRDVEDKAVECSSIDVDAATLGLKPVVHRHGAADHQSYNKMIDDEHVYHELESLHRLSLLLEERACSSEGELLSPQLTPEEKSDSRTSSPIYAVPYDSQRNSLCSENPLLPEFSSKLHVGSYENPYARVQPLSIESPFFQKSQPSGYAVPGRREPPVWHPPPPPIEKEEEIDFLAELDKQIAELQIQSHAVQQLVEKAKERQELRERTRLLCMEHINELRKMRWFMRNNFELCL